MHLGALQYVIQNREHNLTYGRIRRNLHLDLLLGKPWVQVFSKRSGAFGIVNAGLKYLVTALRFE